MTVSYFIDGSIAVREWSNKEIYSPNQYIIQMYTYIINFNLFSLFLSIVFLYKVSECV